LVYSNLYDRLNFTVSDEATQSIEMHFLPRLPPAKAYQSLLAIQVHNIITAVTSELKIFFVMQLIVWRCLLRAHQLESSTGHRMLQ
jgi:hypothetical protein